MKKILAVLLAMSSILFVSAQSNRSYPGGSRDVILGKPKVNGNDRNVYGNNRYGTYSFTDRERDAQVQRIRFSYAQKIREVQHSRFLRKTEKRRQVRMLERQRDLEIKNVNERFKDRRNVYNNKRYNSNKRRY